MVSTLRVYSLLVSTQWLKFATSNQKPNNIIKCKGKAYNTFKTNTQHFNAFCVIVNITKLKTEMSLATRLLKNVCQSIIKYNCISNNRLLHLQLQRNFHISKLRCDLMEFFDTKDNWGEKEIRCGRSWTVDELRLKSNSDLHKLWYVLLKEKNMLFTMEHAAKKEAELFPSPERIDKVEISMENIEAVVRERNKAYFLLETGQTGERPHDWKEDEFGRFDYVPLEEHSVPMKENEKYMEEGLFPTMETVNPTVPEFLLKLREKELRMERRERRLKRKHIKMLFKEFPNLDMEALQADYPDIDVYQYKKYLEDKDDLMTFAK